MNLAFRLRLTGSALAISSVLLVCDGSHVRAQGLPATQSPAPSVRPSMASSAEHELEAIRRALLDKALAASTRVRSTAWINERGELQEASQFQSELTVRGVRVLEYLDDPAAPQPALTAEAIQSEPPSRGEKSDEPCPSPRTQRHLRHGLGLRAGLESSQPQALRGPALSALSVVLGGLDREAAVRGWTLGRDPAVMPTVPGRVSAYEAAVYGREEPREPLVLSVSGLLISGTAALAEDDGASGSDGLDRMRGWAGRAIDQTRSLFGMEPGGEVPARLNLSFEIMRRGSTDPAKVMRVSLPVTVESIQRPQLRLSAADLERVRKQTAIWWASVERTLSCEPLVFEARTLGEGRFSLLAGTEAGLRVGDRLVLTDGARVPRRLLEAQAAAHLGLVEVERLSGDRAVVRQVAGPTLGNATTSWLALPY